MTTQNRPFGRLRSLFRLLVGGVLLAPLAVLLHLKTGLELLLVLLGVIVHPLALGALQLDEVVLGHMGFRLMGAVCVKRFLSSRPSLTFHGWSREEESNLQPAVYKTAA